MLDIKYSENDLLEMAVVQSVGDRSEQQDCFAYILNDDGGLFLLCDGMGGHEGGIIASHTTADYIMDSFSNRSEANPVVFLGNATKEADKKVHEIRKSDGSYMNAGSTLVSALIEKGELFWSSVGDSRLYISRDGELVKVTTDHNYHEYLKEKLADNVITVEDYKRENVRGDALLCYIGAGELKLIDYNNSPFKVEAGDKILLMSDGVYRILEDSTIAGIISNFKNLKDAADAVANMTEQTARMTEKSRDNMTFMIIKVK